MAQQSTTYEVVERHRHLYYVEEVRTETPIVGGKPVIERWRLRWFLTQEKAEALANGLATGAWTRYGPIVATYIATEENS